MKHEVQASKDTVAKPFHGIDYKAILVCLGLAIISGILFWYGKLQVIHGTSGPLVFDGEFYASIANHGYVFDGNILHKQNTAFMPLMSMLIKLAKYAIPATNTFLEVFVLGFLLLAFTLFGIYLFTKKHFGAKTAVTAVVLWSLSPLSLYNFTGYSDPLYALLTIWTLLALTFDKQWAACILAGLALICRPQAVILAAMVLICISYRNRYEWRSILASSTPAKFALMVIPLMALATFFALRFGDSTLYINSLEAWRAGSFNDGNAGPLRSLKFFFDSASGANTVLSPWTAMLATLALVSTAFCIVFCMRESPMATFFVGSSLIFLLAATSFNAFNYARHFFYLAPLPIMIAAAVHKRTKSQFGALALISPWLALSILINILAIGRYYHGMWVS